MPVETADERRARMTENTRRWRNRHPERVKESRRRVYLNRKRRALAMLGGAHCASCGCDALDILEVNHIRGGGSKEWRERGNWTIDSILSGSRPVDDLNVLCRVCNALDYVMRKNPEAASRLSVRWEKLTGKKATLEPA